MPLLGARTQFQIVYLQYVVAAKSISNAPTRSQNTISNSIPTIYPSCKQIRINNQSRKIAYLQHIVA
jgi:hypothetical protein